MSAKSASGCEGSCAAQQCEPTSNAQPDDSGPGTRSAAMTAIGSEAELTVRPRNSPQPISPPAASHRFVPGAEGLA